MATPGAGMPAVANNAAAAASADTGKRTVPVMNQAPTQGPGPRPYSGSSMILYVGNISPTIKHGDLLPLLKACGAILTWRRIVCPETGMARKFGFVEYANEDGASLALKFLNGTSVGKFKLVVKPNTAAAAALKEWEEKHPVPDEFTAAVRKASNHNIELLERSSAADCDAEAFGQIVDALARFHAADTKVNKKRIEALAEERRKERQRIEDEEKARIQLAREKIEAEKAQILRELDGDLGGSTETDSAAATSPAVNTESVAPNSNADAERVGESILRALAEGDKRRASEGTGVAGPIEPSQDQGHHSAKSRRSKSRSRSRSPRSRDRRDSRRKHSRNDDRRRSRSRSSSSSSHGRRRKHDKKRHKKRSKKDKKKHKKRSKHHRSHSRSDSSSSHDAPPPLVRNEDSAPGNTATASKSQPVVASIPVNTDELFAFPINWVGLESAGVIVNKIQPWLTQQIAVYMGEAPQELVDFVLVSSFVSCDLSSIPTSPLMSVSHVSCRRNWRAMRSHKNLSTN